MANFGAIDAGGAVAGIPLPLFHSGSNTNKKMLLNNAGEAQSESQQLFGQGSGIGGFLTPQLEQQANNPQGYTPAQLAYMNTASQQSAGGGTGAVTGQANLQAARTRNAGGFQGAIGSGSRAAQQDLSNKALQVQTGQAQLQQQQKEEALKQLGQLYGTDLSSSQGFLNTSNQAILDRMGKGGGSGSSAIGAAGSIGAAALMAL